MRDLDRMIDAALDAEERELLHSIGEEPGFFGLAFGMFRGPTGWANAMLMLVQGVAFVGGAWAAWNFFSAADALAALRWGLPAAVLLLLSAMDKLSLWPAIHTNRLMRELKLIQLQLAHGSGSRHSETG